MPPENLKLYNVRVRPTLWEQARKVAEARGGRISDVIREQLKDYVHKHRKLLEEIENAQ
jgi:hypothetical protein